LKIGFLYQILGLRVIAHQAQGDAKKLIRIAEREFFKFRQSLW
jgi:hypothetical protein